MNRRNFIKNTSVGLGALSLCPILGTTNNNKKIFSCPSETSHAVEWIEKNIKRYDVFLRQYVPLELNNTQLNFIHIIEARDIGFNAYIDYPKRQMGYTTASMAYLLYRLIHDDNSNFLAICLNYTQCTVFVDRIQEMCNYLPNQLSQVKSYSRDRYTININSNKLIISSYDSICFDLRHSTCRYKLAFAQDYSYSNVSREWEFESQFNIDRIIGHSFADTNI